MAGSSRLRANSTYNKTEAVPRRFLFRAKVGRVLAAPRLFAFKSQTQGTIPCHQFPIAGLAEKEKEKVEQQWIRVLWNAGVSPWRKWIMPNSRGITFGMFYIYFLSLIEIERSSLPVLDCASPVS